MPIKYDDIGRGTHSSYMGISSRVRLPPANQKLLFLFIYNYKIRIIERITWKRYIHPRILILRSHSSSQCRVSNVTLLM